MVLPWSVAGLAVAACGPGSPEHTSTITDGVGGASSPESMSTDDAGSAAESRDSSTPPERGDAGGVPPLQPRLSLDCSNGVAGLNLYPLPSVPGLTCERTFWRWPIR